MIADAGADGGSSAAPTVAVLFKKLKNTEARDEIRTDTYMPFNNPVIKRDAARYTVDTCHSETESATE